MASASCEKLLAHTGARVQDVLYSGQFGMVLLISHPFVLPKNGSETTPLPSQPHHPHQSNREIPQTRTYAAKVVLLATKKRRRRSSTSSSSRSSTSERSGHARSSRDQRRRTNSLTTGGSNNEGTAWLSPDSVRSGDSGDNLDPSIASDRSSSSPVGFLSAPHPDEYCDSGSSGRSNGTGSGCTTREEDPAVSSIFREIDVLQSLRPDPSCHVVQYVGMKRNYECVALLYEYMAGGSVKDELERNGPLLPWTGIAATAGGRRGGMHPSSSGGDRATASKRGRLESYTRQMLCGVQWLHDNGVCHRDIKCSNLLLSQDMELLKVSDFGQIKWVSSQSARGISGSPLWLAPEVI